MAVRFPDLQKLGSANLLEEELATVPRYHEMQHLVAVETVGKFLRNMWCPRGITTDSNTHQIYIAQGNWNNFARISVLSETGKLLAIFTPKQLKYPWGIAIHKGNLYVTDVSLHCVFHFNVSSLDIRLVGRIGSEGSVYAQFQDPRQLTVSPNGEVLVTDHYNDRIQILDSHLNYKRTIKHPLMIKPVDIKMTSDVIYVLCASNPCIHVFSSKGEIIRSLITRGRIRMQVTFPLFFCLDAKENLIISDCEGHQVKIFSPEGTLLFTHNIDMGRHHRYIENLSLPYGIALTNSHKLVVVALNGQHGLQIFSCF